jgi:hypothetical protein
MSFDTFFIFAALVVFSLQATDPRWEYRTFAPGALAEHTTMRDPGAPPPQTLEGLLNADGDNHWELVGEIRGQLVYKRRKKLF